MAVMASQKGKKATKGQKQIVEENKSTLTWFRNMILGANGIYYLFALVLLNDCFTGLNIFMLVFTAGLSLGSYYFMSHISVPKYTETGQILDSGIDLNMEGGISEHMKDLIILSSGCQLLSMISKYFWLLWLLAPARAFWLAWVNILSPYFFQESPPQEVDEKKQRKLERKMKRGL
uniref:Transmembrane protein 208 n=1 Tax=Clastoptera arizonana TaxID=38151 RepID=A0A1B6DIC2_9HEMI